MAAEEGDVGKPKRQLRRALGLDDDGELWLPRKRSSTILAGIERHRERGCWFDFRGDAAFAPPELYEYLESEGYLYAIRLPANAVLEREIEPFLTRPVGRPPRRPIIWYHDFLYQAASWDAPRRLVAKIEWHAGELFPRVGFIVTNLWRAADRVVRFYNGRGPAVA